MSDEPMPEPELPTILRPLGTLLDRARRGDTDVLPELRDLLDAHPEIWQACGDLAAHAQKAWIDLAVGDDLVARESLERHVAALKAELAGPAPSATERLLIGRIAACWLQVHYADAAAAHTHDVSLKQAKFVLQRQDRAHRRYVQAIGTLGDGAEAAAVGHAGRAGAVRSIDAGRHHRRSARRPAARRSVS